MPIDYSHELDPVEPRKRYKKPKPVEAKHKVSLEDAIATLQDLGFEIHVPTTLEDRKKQESSIVALGFKSSSKVVKSKPNNTRLQATLITSHQIGGSTYGPGLIDLAANEHDLFRTLLQQDQACVNAHMDTSDYIRSSRCFLIQPGRSNDRKNKFSKIEISEAMFNSDMVLNMPGVTVERNEIAGINPIRQGASF